MDSRTQPAADRVYEDFEPHHEWAKDERLISVLLPAYRRDQLKVQVTSKPILRLMGERLITQNRWHRFNLEFPLPSDYDTDKVTAKFEGGWLSVQFGQLIKPKETTPEEAPRPKEPSQKVDQPKATQEDTPKAKEDKAEEARTNGQVSDDQKTPQKEEPVNETQKGKTETTTETTEAATSEIPKTKNAKLVARSKTRLIDFTLGFGPSDEVESEAIGDSDAGLNKWKKRVKWVVLILLLVGLGLYARTAFRTSHGESNFQEL